MITPDFLNNVVMSTENKVYDLNTKILKRVSEKVADSFSQFDTMELPLTLMAFQKYIASQEAYSDIQAVIDNERKNVTKEVKKAFLESASEVSDHNTQIAKDIVKGTDIKVPDYEKVENPTKASQLNLTEQEVKYFEDAYKKASRTVNNLTKTMPSAGQQAYINACNTAYLNAKHGMSVNDAIVNAVEEMAKQGIKVVNYDSGKVDRVEVAIARAVRTAINQLNSKIVLNRCASMGLDYVQVSAHLGARVTEYSDYTNHSLWQGKVYSLDWSCDVLKGFRPELNQKGRFAWLVDVSKYVKGLFKKKYPDFVKNTGYGEMLGLSGINCRHSFWAFNPKTDDDTPIEIDAEENLKQYNAEQKARAMERAIREDKRKILCVEAMGAKGIEIERDITKLRNKLKKHEYLYGEHIKKYNITADSWRKTVSEKTVNEVGNLDKNIYKSISDKIKTDKVIITQNRINHINEDEAHPFTFDKYGKYIKKVIEEPDYILSDPEPDTAIVLKEITEEDKHFRLILKLVTTENDIQNSVITYFEISEKKWKKYIKNKRIVYKKADTVI